MTLTVPRAGLTAGRAANAAGMPVAEPQTGGLLADLGNAILEKQARLRAERDDLLMQQTNLDMARDLGRARLDVDQISDPDELDRSWQERSQAIYAERVATIKDPQLRQKAELDWQRLNDRQSLAVGERAISLTQSQRAAKWVEHKTLITAEAATADPETFGIYLEQGLAAIDARLAYGDLTPEQAALERGALQSDMLASRATQAISTNPDAFLAAVEAGEYNGLGGNDLTRFRSSAEAERARRAEAAQKAADQQLDQQRAALKKRLTQQSDIFDAGLSATDEALLTDPNVVALVNTDPDLQQAHAKAMAAKSLRDEKPNIRQMTPAELRAQIEAERNTPKDMPFQAERVKVLEGWLAKAETEFSADGIKASRAAGLPVPDLPELDPANPQTLAEGFAQRLTYDAWQRKQGYAAPQAILSGDEQARFKAVLDPRADVPAKLALAEAVARGAGPEARRLAGIMGADPVFNRAVRIVQETGDRDLAQQILKGQQKEALGTVSLPPKAQRQLLFAEVTGGAFSGDSAREAEIMEAASALYAAEAAGVNPDGENTVLPFTQDTEAQDLYRSAIARVTGARPDRNGDLSIGGLQEVNGARVVLPKGIGRDMVEDAWDRVDAQLRGGVWDDRYQSWSFAGEAADPLRALKSASIDPGAAPALGANARGQWQGARPRRVGESDVYELVITRNGRDVPVPIEGDPQGRAYRFRMRSLIEGAQR
jgi:hypothetical protein